MRRELVRPVALVGRELRRQTQYRSRRLLTRGDSAGTEWAVHRRVPVQVRIDPGLRLGQQREHAWTRLSDLLRAAGISFWSQPEPGRNDVLCVDAADRAEVLRLLPGLGGSSWHVDLLRPDGGARGRPVPVGSTIAPRRLEQAAGLAVHEYVAAASGSRFMADERQGVRILFWRHEEGRLVTSANDGTATTMPEGWSSTGHRGEVPEIFTRRPSATVGFPVDVVYTWVDGDDEGWLRQKAAALGASDPDLFTERAHDASRYADHDELRFSLRALEQFAPWVNHVWVVTAGQHPRWLRPDDPWVTVVPHRDVWPDEAGLPTFNSHAIETCLHRIPGLAEHFLYLNDDMVLGRPVRPDAFFHPSGLGKFFWSRALVDHEPSRLGDIASSSAAKNARRLLEERFGVTFTRKFFHTAAALTVSGLVELEETFPGAVAETRRTPFRTLSDVAMAGSFYLNWAYVRGRAVPGRLRYTYIDPAAPDARRRLEQLGRRRNFDAFCINDGSTEETEVERRETDGLIRAFFADYLPVPGSFEA